MSAFFVNRPVFSIVLALLISLTGLLAMRALPMEQFPEVAPTTINISATYNGASAQTVENTVTQIIEQQLTGIDGLAYFSSRSSSTGEASVDVVFDQSVHPDTAQIQVTNKLQQVESRLPDAVLQNGVRVTHRQAETFLIVSVYDETDRSTTSDIGDYVTSTLYDQLSRIEGIGNIENYGSQYSMRIWLDPNKMASYSLMPSDVISAVRTQNIQVSAGSIGAQPTSDSQRLTATVIAQSMLQTPEQFRNIVVKHSDDGAVVHLSDVANVEMGSESYATMPSLNGHPTAALGLQLASGANALETADRVYALIDEIRPQLPSGYVIAYPRDSTEFIHRSIGEVIHTLLEATVLVVVVMFIFLGNWRATIIPTLTVPVVLLGTFAVLAALSYTINSLTLFAMVLAIGLLVDDTIVVVENVERLMQEQKMSAKEATVESMKEVTGSLIGIAVVLSVVFLPMAFFGGATGIIYRQFSITIIAAMFLSVIVALTLAPALCGSLLKPRPADTVNWFQRFFEKATAKYAQNVRKVLRKMTRWMVSYGCISLLALFMYTQLPTGFIPNEDQGGLVVAFTLPDGADMSRTSEVDRKVRRYFNEHEQDNLDLSISTMGRNYNGQGQNLGMTWIKLKDWEDRPGEENSAQAIASRAAAALDPIHEAQVHVILYPPIRGVGDTDGFEFQLQAKPSMTRAELTEMRQALLSEANKSSLLSGVRSGRTLSAPQLHVNFDQERALAYGIELSDIYATLNTAWAGTYVNDFLDRSRIKRVYVQSDGAYRSRPEDLGVWTVRNARGEMVPLSGISTTAIAQGIESLERYNGLASYQISGSAAAGASSGEAMNEVAKIADTLGGSYAWSGLSYQEQQSAGQTLPLYALSILVIFLCLAALYESWSIPLSVLLVIPLGVFGAVAATYFRGLDNNVYFQVALLSTIGLSSKNAIMMIAFMETSQKEGMSLTQAAVHSAQMRLRPILMTSIAFVAGVIPLAISSGVGANSRIAIGTGIVGGTVTATILALFFVPIFFILVSKLFKKATNA